MARAVWNGTVIAEGDDVELVEGNVYFRADDVDERYLRPSDHKTVCPWKGTARYYDVVVGGAVNENAAWYYPEPRERARPLVADRVAFWRGVQVDPGAAGGG